MEITVRERLVLSLTPKPLDRGSPEERACFGKLSVKTGELVLTEGIDHHDECRSCDGPLVSGYHLAEWLAWNWWRLRWEWWYRLGSSDDVVDGWDFAHRMSTVGEGYVWPNITIASDGYQTALVSDPSLDSRAASFRYFGAPISFLPSKSLEVAIDGFVSYVLERLASDGIKRTNLHSLWDEVSTERQEPETAFFRRMEARLGYDPDEVDQLGLNHRWLADAKRLGRDALEELAADSGYSSAQAVVMSADHISEIANHFGFEADRKDAVKLAPRETDVEWGDVQAWEIGEDYARRLHLQEDLDAEKPISNELLASLAAVPQSAIADSERVGELSFILDSNGSGTRLVLGSKWETGRRFALARIIGDRLFGWTDKLLPATRSYSYRQKAQRAFAAELLSPFQAVNDMLGPNDSEERQNEIAQHYNVSPRMIESILVNKGRMSREEASGIVSQRASLGVYG